MKHYRITIDVRYEGPEEVPENMVHILGDNVSRCIENNKLLVTPDDTPTTFRYSTDVIRIHAH